MDRARIESFLDRFVDFAAGATTIGLLALSDRSGLSAYLGEHGGGTATEIAELADLNERYVLEILSGLAAAEVVEYDPATQRFELPPEHALFLSSELSPYFMGGWLDDLPAAIGQLDGIAEAVKSGGGVRFEDFGEEMIKGLDRGNGPSQRVFLTTKWLPGVADLTDRLERGINVADIGCGVGTAAILMAAAYPKSHVTGFDVSAPSISEARDRAGDLDNIEFRINTIDEIPTEPKFDFISTFDVIHDLVNPLAGLKRIRKALAPDGLYLMMEPRASSNLEGNINPRGALLYGISVLHCMTQSLALGGEGLGTAWGDQRAEDYAMRSGFASFEFLEPISNRFSAFYLLTP